MLGLLCQNTTNNY